MPVYVPGMIHYPPEPERIETLTTAAKNRLDAIAGIVAEKDTDPDDDSPHSLRLRLKRTACSLMDSADQSKVSNQIPFYAADGCTECGTCASVCLSGRIEIDGARPSWREDVQCYHCYACFAYCPTQSVLLQGRYDKRDGRYSHPEITAQDIAAQFSDGAQ